MFRLSRNAIVIAVSCVILAIAYAALAVPLHYNIEWAGVTMLIALGAAMGIMVAVLDTGHGE
jgi:type III secretory pathway component EscT